MIYVLWETCVIYLDRRNIFMCICETFKIIWCAFIYFCKLCTCLYYECCFVGLQKHLKMSSRGEDPSKTERSPFSVEWLNSCYQQTLLPDAPWHAVRYAKDRSWVIFVRNFYCYWDMYHCNCQVNGDFFRWRVRLPSLWQARWRNSLVKLRERRPWCSP